MRKKPSGGAFAGDERPVAFVDVGGQQLRRVRIGSAQQHRRHALDVGSKTCRVQRADVLRDRHQHLAAEMAALLLRGELVLEMHAGGAGLDHRLHELERVQRAAEPGFGVRHDRRHPVGSVVTFRMRDLVGAAQRIVDPPHYVRHGIDRIQRLVRIHLAGGIGIGRDLPTGQVDRLQSCLDLLHGLVAGERAKRRHDMARSSAAATVVSRPSRPAYGGCGSDRTGAARPAVRNRGGYRRSGKDREGGACGMLLRWAV